MLSVAVLELSIRLSWSPLIEVCAPLISISAWTRYFAAMALLNTYVVHNLNSLDSYTSLTVDDQELMAARHKRTNHTRASACVQCST